uniref:GNAT family N-acetyltransferase n=1 Tax=Pararhizobium sp. IMCC3301 TaxID=3067904 RepID=UPI0027424C4D|nr:GNAT family N-acetyltransferase [Pararhizobium sp. IMCC3301]
MDFPSNPELTAKTVDLPNGPVMADEPVHIEIHDTPDALRALEAEWRALETRVADGLGYFQTYDWCASWCSFYLEGAGDISARKLQLVTIRRTGQLACIIPLMQENRALGLKLHRSIGAPLTQYSNILLDTAVLPIAEMRLCWKDLCQRFDSDAILLKRFPQASQIAAILDEDNIDRETEEVSLVMKLDTIESWKPFQDSFSKSVRRGRRRRFQKIERELGEVKLEVHFGGTDAYRKAIPQALDFKRKWLKESGRNMAAFSGPNVAEFLMALQGDSAAREGALVYILTAGGKPIAIELGFIQQRHYYCFLGSFDWDHRNYSAGKVQMEQSLKWAIEHQLPMIDYLGNYEAYQGDWSNDTVAMASYRAALTRKGRLYIGLWDRHLKPGAKVAFRRLPGAIRKSLIAALSGR